ncbi:MAG: mevalonate kinase, partial [Gammaproteobacteria bacterium]|nr:mevalonate kinase [Gammaproteobacteria bacterium]
HKDMTIKALKRFKSRLSKDYHGFLQGERSIKDVLKLPHELSHFALSNFLERFNRFSDVGIHLKTESTIPMGCGMGSSAAMILAVKFALAHHFKEDIDKEHLFQLALEAENLQHGYSSGLDLRVSLQGGALEYCKGQFKPLLIPSEWPLYMVNTGSPDSTTGECVSHTKSLFEKTTLAEEIGTVTQAVKTALNQQHFRDFQTAIRANHQLLTALEVVPLSIQEFIHYLEQQGAAAKICGAGSIAGNKAGVVLIASEKNPFTWCQRFGYTAEEITGDAHGLRLG